MDTCGILLVVFLVTSAASAPLEDHTFGHPDQEALFIYHDRATNQGDSLLLAVFGTKCVHASVRDRYLSNCRQAMERQFTNDVLAQKYLSESSLQTLRDTFEDLLADFHCLNKTVHMFTFDTATYCDICETYEGDKEDLCDSAGDK